MTRLDTLTTPALILDRVVLERNLDRMAARATRLGVALRPHIKTHKCIEVAALQKERGALCFTVSTLPEAEAMFAAGFDDLTWAFPLSPGKIGPALDLGKRGTLRLLVDDAATFAELEKTAAARGVRPHVWLKVDCGYHRAGVDPASPEALDLAGRMSASGSTVFDGLLTHAGHSYYAYEREQRLAIANQERDVMVGFAGRLRAMGHEVPGVSVGSTPTLTIVENLDGVTEARPGNYAFLDLAQVGLGVCGVEDIAVSILATVVSHPPGAERAVIDAGALSLSKDHGPDQGERSGAMGAVCPDSTATVSDPALRLESISQEHGVIRPSRPGGLRERLPVGSRVRVLPNHSCLAAACFDRLHVLEGDRITDSWTIHRER
jgi:D-serine deaminase-like pyridoxal phosphate-dependent protein